MEARGPPQVSSIWYAVLFTFTTPPTLRAVGAFCNLINPQFSEVQNGLITKGVVWGKVSL